MKKILFLVSSLHVGGAQKALVPLANMLADNGHDVTICIFNNMTDLQDELDERIRIVYKPYKYHLGKSIPYIRHKFYDSGMWENRTSAKNLYSYYVEPEKYDVEIAFSAGIIAKTVEGSVNKDAVRIAWVHSDYAGEGGYSANTKSREELFEKYADLDYVVCVSKHAAESFKKAVGDTGNIVVIRNLLSVEEIQKKSEEKPEVDVKKASFHMVVVARLVDKSKGVLRIAETIIKLKEEGYDISLAIVGEGKDGDRLKKLIEDNNARNYITLAGVSLNPYPYIKEADLLVCPSYYEGYCLSVAEAIALGVPVVSTKCIGTTELLGKGKYGMLVDNSSEGLYYGIKKIMTTPGLLSYYQKMEFERRESFDQEVINIQISSILEKSEIIDVVDIMNKLEDRIEPVIEKSEILETESNIPDVLELKEHIFEAREDEEYSSDTPRLTVVVTVYNIAEHLPRFFECMQKQTFTDYRLLIVDDGSTDESLEICRQYAEKEGRIKIVALEHMGISAARDKAMEYLDTPLTVYADGDDYFGPDYLTHLINGYDKNKADLVISGVIYNSSADLSQTDQHESWGNQLITENRFEEALPLLLWDRNLNYLYSKIFKTKLLKNIRVGANIMQGSDTIIVFNYLSKIHSIEMIDEADYHYVRYKSRSVTSTRGVESFDRLIRLNRYLHNYCIENGMMTESMQHAVDGRILLLTSWCTNQIVYMDLPKEEKIRQLEYILGNEYYIEAYNRQKERKTLKYEDFKPKKLMTGEEYLDRWTAERENMKRKAGILEITPSFIKRIYRWLK